MMPSLFEQPHITQPPQEALLDNKVAGTPADTIQQSKKISRVSIFKLSAIYLALFLTPITGAYAATMAGVGPKSSVALVSPVSSLPQQEMNNPQKEDASYELSLSNSFLQKAVALSNSTENQTDQQKYQIIAYLDQALSAANRAVALAPQDFHTYSTRGRVYQAIAVIKPEMKGLADKDLAQAKSLSNTSSIAQTTSTAISDSSPNTTPSNIPSSGIIAAPNPDQQQTTSATAQSNAKRGTAILPTQTTEVFVSYPQVKDTTQLYVTADKNPDNVTLYIKNKEAGVGFTIATTSTPSSPLDITWWEIE